MNEVRKKLIVAQLILLGIPLSTINFYQAAADIISSENGFTWSQVSKVNYMTKQATFRHINRLIDAGVISKSRYSKYYANSSTRIIKDDLLKSCMNGIGDAYITA